MRTIKLLLTIIGCAALFAGIALTAAATSPLLTASMPGWASTQDIIYVGGGTCLTCHENGSDLWSRAPALRHVESGIHNPLASPIRALMNEVLIVPAMDSALSLAQRDAPGAENDQQYIVLTEAGYLPLPAGWQTHDHQPFVPVQGSQTAIPEQCSGCHPDEFSAGVHPAADQPMLAALLSAPPMFKAYAQLTAPITEEHSI
ncbi:MAG: hypothetical protein ACUVS2_05170 [Candidatus Flexifilum sp.]|jgi:cytochrome c553